MLLGFNETHPIYGLLTQIKTFLKNETLGFFSGFDTSESTKFKNWASIIFLAVLILLFTRDSVSIGLATVSVFMFFFMRVSWLTFGNHTLDNAVMAITALITVLVFMMEGDRI